MFFCKKKVKNRNRHFFSTLLIVMKVLQDFAYFFIKKQNSIFRFFFRNVNVILRVEIEKFQIFQLILRIS